MSTLAVQHHVFSSDGGYRTTFASPDLGRVAVRRLEAFASAAQSAFSSGSAHSCMSFDPEHICLCCTFVHGADHVGRQRLCTHSVLIPAALADNESFNAASPPASVFMTPEVPAERPGPYLARQWSLLDKATLRETRRQALVDLDGHNQTILAGLYSPTRTLVIAGDPADCQRRLGSAAWLVPREIRRNLFYRTGSWPQAEARQFGPVSALLLSNPARLADYPVGEFVPIDLHQAPAPGRSHPLVRLLTDMNASLDGQRRLPTLFQMLAAYPGAARPTLDQLTCLARGFQLAEPLFQAHEALDVARASAPTLVKAAFPLARSGRPALAARLIELLDKALEHSQRSVLKDTLATLEAKLNESFQSHGEEFGGRLASYHRRLTEVATARRTRR